MSRTISVTRSFTFDAAHQIPDYPGPCAHLHGHTYRLEVTVSGPVGPNGMVVDFAILKRIVHQLVLTDLDHTFLNKHIDNPTVERVGEEIVDRLLKSDLPITRVQLWETPTCYVEIVL